MTTELPSLMRTVVLAWRVDTTGSSLFGPLKSTIELTSGLICVVMKPSGLMSGVILSLMPTSSFSTRWEGAAAPPANTVPVMT